MLEQDEHEMKESRTPGVSGGSENWFCHALPLRLQEIGSGHFFLDKGIWSPLMSLEMQPFQ